MVLCLWGDKYINSRNNIIFCTIVLLTSPCRQGSYDESLNPFGEDVNQNAAEERVKKAEVKTIK